MSPEKLVYMANQIGRFFAHQRDERAALSVADHLRRFWDPRMRAALAAHVEAGGSGLSDTALQGARLLLDHRDTSLRAGEPRRVDP